MVVAIGIGRRQRAALVVVGTRADPALTWRMGERVHGAVKPEPCETRSLTSARAESGTPEEALGLGHSEAAVVVGRLGHCQSVSPDCGDFLTSLPSKLYFLTRSVACMPLALWPEIEHQSE
jgi:hypothetical protein